MLPSTSSSVLQKALKAAIAGLEAEDSQTLQASIEEMSNAVRFITVALSLRGVNLSRIKQEALLCVVDSFRARITAWRGQLMTGESNLSSCTKKSTLGPRQSDQGQLQGLEELRADCMRTPQSTWADIAGMDAVKESLFESFFLPLRYPQLFQGIRSPPANFLLTGKPGTGKTLLAEAMAGETGFNFFVVTPSAVLSKWTGESERMIKGAFALAKAMKPAMLFFDEIDALGSKRGTGDDVSSRRVLTELLVQLSQVKPSDQVYVVAATNRLDDLDEALIRRFETRLMVPLPDAESRQKIVQLYLRGVGSELTNGELRYISDETKGYSCSDLRELCRAASMRPAKEAVQWLGSGADSGGDIPTVRRTSVTDFQEVLLQYKPASWRSPEDDGT